MTDTAPPWTVTEICDGGLPTNASMQDALIYETVCQKNTFMPNLPPPDDGGGSDPPDEPNEPEENDRESELFDTCMANGASQFSLVGIVDNALSWVYDEQVDTFKNDPIVGFLGSNSVLSVLYGDLNEAGGVAGLATTDLTLQGMGNPITHSRRTTDVLSLNLAGKGGRPFALGTPLPALKNNLLKVSGFLRKITVPMSWDIGMALGGALKCSDLVEEQLHPPLLMRRGG